MSAPRMSVVGLAAIAAGVGVIALVLASHHQDAKAVWVVFGPAVGWSFVGTGLYAGRRRPESRTGLLMVLLGFAWFLFILQAANSAILYTLAAVLGGLWGGLFLHMSNYPIKPPAPRLVAQQGSWPRTYAKVLASAQLLTA